MFSNDEQKRYARHIILPEIGEKGQQKLKSAKVLVVGAGGLGCPVLQYLTAAGVGKIGIADFDKVSLSNLQRQILFTGKDIGKNKALVAKERLKQLNSHVNFISFTEKISSINAEEIFSQFDIIVDCSDNFSTRYLINDVCVKQNKPFVYASIQGFEGQLSVFNYQGRISYRTLYPDMPVDNVPNCSEIGVLGVLPGIMGCLQANEVLKIILDLGDVLSGKLLVYNSLKNDFSIFDIVSNLQKDTSIDFNLQQESQIRSIHFLELKENATNWFVIDVREWWEEPKLEEIPAVNVPLSDLENYLEKHEINKPAAVFCQTGNRSSIAVEILKKKGIKEIYELKGGLSEYF